MTPACSEIYNNEKPTKLHGCFLVRYRQNSNRFHGHMGMVLKQSCEGHIDLKYIFHDTLPG
jgi:hypothetical protein